MNLFGGFFGDMADDPFFSGHMRQMNRMMDPFEMLGGFGGFGFGRPGGPSALMPFGFNSIMDNFKNEMQSGNVHSFSSSTMMTMSSGPDGRPQIYRESSSTRTAPGGIKETKESVCDSRSGTKRLAIGRHIGDRGHVRERLQNMRSGEREETEDFINLEEDDAEQFNREWGHRTRDLSGRPMASLGYRSRGREDTYDRPLAIMPAAHSPRSRYRPSGSLTSRRSPTSAPALTYSRSRHSADAAGPIIEEVEDDNEIVVESSRKRPREREVPEITEVTDSAGDRAVPRKIKQRSRKFTQKSSNQ